MTSPFSLFFALACVYCLMIQTITKSAICLDKVPLPRSISCHLITGSAGSQTATSPPNYETSVELGHSGVSHCIVQDFGFIRTSYSSEFSIFREKLQDKGQSNSKTIAAVPQTDRGARYSWLIILALARVYCLMIQTITKSAICLDKVPLPRSISCHLITGSAGSQTATSPPNYETSVELGHSGVSHCIVQDFGFIRTSYSSEFSIFREKLQDKGQSNSKTIAAVPQTDRGARYSWLIILALARVYCLMIQTITKSAICLDKVPLPRSISCHLITGSAGSQTATSPPNYETSVELGHSGVSHCIVQDFGFIRTSYSSEFSIFREKLQDKGQSNSKTIAAVP